MITAKGVAPMSRCHNPNRFVDYSVIGMRHGGTNAPRIFPKCMTTLRLPPALRTRLEQWARGGYPHETCGLLLGHVQDQFVEVKEAAIARNLNVERAADRYELDPAAFVAADAQARAAGMDIIGIWHSHPDHPARPSQTDRAAAWTGWSYVILSVSRDGVEDLRSWRLDGDRFVEVEVEAWVA